MVEPKDAARNLGELASHELQAVMETNARLFSAAIDQARMLQTYWVGLTRYILDFMSPSFSALEPFSAVENQRLKERPPWENLRDYLALLEFNLRLGEKGLAGGLKAMNDFHAHQLRQAANAWLNTVQHRRGEDIADFMAKQARLMELVVYDYPQAIRNIEPEYGFHFDDGRYRQVAETARFYLYQILPREKGVRVRKNGKPIVIVPPYVLGANILSFLPDEGKSYAHCFANQGIPTYIRIVKDIYANPAVQVMTGEDDCLDTKLFLEEVKARHGRPVTLSGYCQGGFTAVVNYLSGELDGLVDALITSVAPMDGTRSKGLQDFLNLVPDRFYEVVFAIKTLPNGNRVVNGKLLSWVFKLKSLEKDNPLTAFFRDLKLFERDLKINKTAAAINYWLLYDQTDLPFEVCKMSYDSYTIPVTQDGTLPVTLFGRTLNFKRIKEKGIKWLICIAEKDDLVEKESTLAPLDWVDAEVTVFPKGHVAIATSWSLPTTECSLDRCFLDYRGPVRYQLDLEAEGDAARKTPPRKTSKDGTSAPGGADASKGKRTS
ncbi:MAG: metal transporter [Deltaproteobacteria bacterium]|nr:metal transporter [Deltaproteobacteria bacterium]